MRLGLISLNSILFFHVISMCGCYTETNKCFRVNDQERLDALYVNMTNIAKAGGSDHFLTSDELQYFESIVSGLTLESGWASLDEVTLRICFARTRPALTKTDTGYCLTYRGSSYLGFDKYIVGFIISKSKHLVSPSVLVEYIELEKGLYLFIEEIHS